MLPASINLDSQQARHILRLAGIDGPVAVTPLKRDNHVWRLQRSDDAYVLKTYTKDWYGEDVAATAGCVRHEQAAYAILAARGIPAPAVVLARPDGDNPLGRPFIVTRELAGTSLVPLLRRHAHDRPAFAALLEAAGAHLCRVHDIAFGHPGYLTSLAGPAGPPDDGAWGHPIWTARRAQQDALATLDADRPRLSPATAARLEAAFSSLAEALAPAYHPPRFVHGDCHAEQFFLARDGAGGGWRVTGFVDMEVASAGATEYDFLKVAIELTSAFPPATRWWEPLFAGYGREPDVERLRLLLLAAAEPNFTAYGEDKWPATREATLAHLLAARGWHELFTRP